MSILWEFVTFSYGWFLGRRPSQTVREVETYALVLAPLGAEVRSDLKSGLDALAF